MLLNSFKSLIAVRFGLSIFHSLVEIQIGICNDFFTVESIFIFFLVISGLQLTTVTNTVVHTHGANLTHQKLLPKKYQKLKPANVIKPQRKAVCIYLQTFLRHFKTIPFPNQYFYTNVFKTVQRRLICIFNVSPNKLLMRLAVTPKKARYFKFFAFNLLTSNNM